jgi:hypothetical protein
MSKGVFQRGPRADLEGFEMVRLAPLGFARAGGSVASASPTILTSSSIGSTSGCRSPLSLDLRTMRGRSKSADLRRRSHSIRRRANRITSALEASPEGSAAFDRQFRPHHRHVVGGVAA